LFVNTLNVEKHNLYILKIISILNIL